MPASPVPKEHGRFPYSPIVDRPPLTWPNGARVALWVIPNIEHFYFDRPATSVERNTRVPDVLNYSWRDYGVRVGIWRMMDIMQRHGIKGTVALNSDVCQHYPRIIETGNELGWEWMGHGFSNSVLINEAAGGRRARADQVCGRHHHQERRHRAARLARPGAERDREHARHSGRERHRICRRLGQRRPALSDAGGIGADVLNALFDRDQRYPGLIGLHQSPERFGQMICDQFDVLYEDGAKTGRVMSICLHPFLTGHPHRSKYFDKALAHIRSRQEVWYTTGSEILDWYKANYLTTAG